ncbi:MAG TPA: peptidase C39 family protein [Kiloniellales bacterium]|nr:peptidase C39 family protein [Kiloniellales bacterium]
MAQVLRAARRAPHTSPVSIRPGRPGDIPALVEIETRCFAQERLSRRSFQHLLTRGHSLHLVAEVDGRIAGYAIVLLNRGTSLARLYSFAIDPDFRGRGLGTRLLAEIEALAAAEGRAFMRLEVRQDNAVAVKRYRDAGYREFGHYPDYYEDHSDALRMEKALAGGARPELMRVPYYPQTLEFTCGPACLIMAMKALDPGLRVDRTLEIALWRESTTIYMTSGHGGCGPNGLALAAWRRGFETRVHGGDEKALFLESVRSETKKEVIRLVQDDFRRQIRRAGIKVVEKGLGTADLMRCLEAGAVPVVLISSYRMYGEKAPHWVVVTGFDERFFYLHDPYIEEKKRRTAADCINVPIARADFERMTRYGSARLRAAVILLGKRPT